MHLVVGLGNPGEEYAATPHNAGFLVVDRLAAEHGIRVTRPDSKALVGVGQIGGRPVMLAKPQTYMNLSGTAVAALMAKHEIGLSGLIVIWDELNLPWGHLRILLKGSAGGHNGAESVIRNVGTQEFCRVRIGIHPGRPIGDGAEYVLAPMRKPLRTELEAAVDQASEAVAAIITGGAEKAMTKFNRRAPGKTEEA